MPPTPLGVHGVMPNPPYITSHGSQATGETSKIKIPSAEQWKALLASEREEDQSGSGEAHNIQQTSAESTKKIKDPE